MLARFAFRRLDPTFVKRASAGPGSFIVAGRNYGQGSSREHAAIVLRYLGVQAVIAVSFARIHAANLVNFGIVPLTFAEPRDLDLLMPDDTLTIDDLVGTLAGGVLALELSQRVQPVMLRHDLSARVGPASLTGA